MVETQVNERQLTLPALLAARARAASDGRLAMDVGGGLIAASLALALRPLAWPLVIAAATCFIAYGMWGITDRALHERPPGWHGIRLLRTLRAGAATLGALGVLAMGGMVMGFLLGNWIH